MIARLGGYDREVGWSIVTRATLLWSDAELWAEYHDDALCPGVAEVDLDGDGRDEFAITEVSHLRAMALTIY